MKLSSGQFRVLKALVIREMQAQNSKLSYGYAWALLEVLLALAFLALIKIVIRLLAPPGMPPVTFLIIGILPWLIFFNSMMATEKVISQNKRLLNLPNVSPLDLVLAKAVQMFCTYGIVYLGTVAVAAYVEGAGFPRFPAGLVVTYFISWMFGISLGLIMMPLLRVFPPAGSFIHPFFRLGVLFGGVYFVITQVPQNYWPYLTWNPMLHVMELDRTFWFRNYQTPVGSITYLLIWVSFAAVLGLSLERYARQRIPA